MCPTSAFPTGPRASQLWLNVSSVSFELLARDRLRVWPCFKNASFSAGRELSKLAIAWQAAAYGSDPAVFTPELMASVTDAFLEQKVCCVGGWVFIGLFPMCPLRLGFVASFDGTAPSSFSPPQQTTKINVVTLLTDVPSYPFVWMPS